MLPPDARPDVRHDARPDAPEQADTSLDGVRPRAAECVHCGYRFNGIPIRHAAIVCPECGRTTTFFLKTLTDHDRTEALLRSRTRAWLAILAGAALFAAVVWLLYR